MGWYTKKTDPIEQRVRDLERELAELTNEISRSEQAPREKSAAPPSFRSSFYPGQSKPGKDEAEQLLLDPNDQSVLREPIRYLQEKLDGLSAKPTGLRAKLKELKENVGASPASNPKLLKYLSTGNLEGLQPLRREKRIARNRVLFLTVLLALVLLGLASVLMENR